MTTLYRAKLSIQPLRFPAESQRDLGPQVFIPRGILTMRQQQPFWMGWAEAVPGDPVTCPFAKMAQGRQSQMPQAHFCETDHSGQTLTLV